MRSAKRFGLKIVIVEILDRTYIAWYPKLTSFCFFLPLFNSNSSEHRLKSHVTFALLFPFILRSKLNCVCAMWRAWQGQGHQRRVENGVLSRSVLCELFVRVLKKGISAVERYPSKNKPNARCEWAQSRHKKGCENCMRRIKCATIHSLKTNMIVISRLSHQETGVKYLCGFLPGNNKWQNEHFQHPHEKFSRKLKVLDLLQEKKTITWRCRRYTALSTSRLFMRIFLLKSSLNDYFGLTNALLNLLGYEKPKLGEIANPKVTELAS